MAAAKRKHLQAKKRQAQLAGHGGGPEGTHGTIWTQWIEPKGSSLLSEMLGPCYFVIKNHGAGSDHVGCCNTATVMDLAPGKVRATYASRGTIRVENRDEKSSALIEFDFLPIFKR